MVEVFEGKSTIIFIDHFNQIKSLYYLNYNFCIQANFIIKVILNVH